MMKITLLLCMLTFVGGISARSMRPQHNFEDRDTFEEPAVERELGPAEYPRMAPDIDQEVLQKHIALKEIEACEGRGRCDLSVEKLVDNMIKYEDGVLREDLKLVDGMLDMPPEEEEHLLQAKIPDADEYKEMMAEEREVVSSVQMKERCRQIFPELGQSSVESQKQVMRPAPSFRPRIPQVCLRFCGLDSRGNRFHCKSFLTDQRFKFLYWRRKLSEQCYHCQRLCDSTTIFY